jgi:gliding motility-associated-like protein
LKEKDNIKDLFSDKLGNFEAKVDPQLWTSISSQIGSVGGAPAGGAGLSMLAKTIIGAAVISGVVLTASYLIPSDTTEDKKENTTINNVPNNANNVDVAKEDVVRETIVQESNSNQITETTTETTDHAFPLDIYKEHLASDDDPAQHIDFDSGLLPEKPKSDEEKGSEENPPVKEEPETRENPPSSEEKTKEEPNEKTSTGEPDRKEPIKLDLPDIFTPNGDGKNDYLTLETEDLSHLLTDLKDFQVVVLDQYSKKVFSSADPYFKWDGTGLDGMPVPAGSYVYFVTAISGDGIPVNGAKQFSIVR